MDGGTVVVYTNEGEIIEAGTAWNPWDQPFGSPSDNVVVGSNMIQIGDFRIGALDAEHLSIGRTPRRGSNLSKYSDSR